MINEYIYIPGVPGRFLFFLGTEGALGLGLGFVFCSWVLNAPSEVDSEKGSPGIICILEKSDKKLYSNAKKVKEKKNKTTNFQRFLLVSVSTRKKTMV